MPVMLASCSQLFSSPNCLTGVNSCVASLTKGDEINVGNVTDGRGTKIHINFMQGAYVLFQVREESEKV